jgi:uncharacterized protein YxjI
MRCRVVIPGTPPGFPRSDRETAANDGSWSARDALSPRQTSGPTNVRSALVAANSIDTMVRATKVGMWSNDYHIEVDGQRVTTWDGSSWRAGGTFTLDDRPYRVRGNVWESEFTMTDQAGTVAATAGRMGRREWTVTAGGQTYRFRRPSVWRNEERLVVGDQEVGSIRRTSMWRSDVEADLPAMPVPVQIFTVVVVLTRWDRRAATAAAG